MAIDANGRPRAAWERWSFPLGSATERELQFRYADDGRLLGMVQHDTGFRDGAVSYETHADLVFEHGSHGEVVLQRATGSQRTTKIEWEGSFRSGETIGRAPTPWDRTFIFSLSLPEDLRSPGLRPSMPPFVFEGTVRMKTEEYGVESVLTYDAEGRLVRHQANVGRFTKEYEHDERGRVARIVSDDGRVAKFQYDGEIPVSASFSTPGEEDAVEIYERDENGALVGSRYEKGGDVRIRARYGPCQRLH